MKSLILQGRKKTLWLRAKVMDGETRDVQRARICQRKSNATNASVESIFRAPNARLVLEIATTATRRGT